MPKVPPLNPLRVFEVVARALNLTTAATELNVTQSAVSRQIAVLEGYLGVQLFHRERLGVSLTAAGAGYAREIAPAFEAITRATAALTRAGRSEPLRVRAYSTFTAQWLIPRLPHLKRCCPDLELEISNAVPSVDFARDSVDIAIQYGHGRWSGVRSELLFEDEIEPVCSPQFIELSRASTDAPLPALLKERLLVSRYRRTDWDDWLGASGHAKAAAGAERMVFGSSVLTWQAAMDGLGIAIGQTHLLKAELDGGRLVRPFALPLRRGALGHYLVRSGLERHAPKVEQFRNWIVDAIRTDRRVQSSK